ncbi:MAG TPA: hypothetical protein DCY88_09520 [Cyanobacteria bacterium UBA11372]|nr:hypothetical protein [Cyanobacteria bacterium UBA11372]
MQALKHQARKLKKETYAIYLACKDPRVAWYAKLLAGCIVAYALSPIDLIPDFIPIIGYLDDLIIVPLLIWLALKMIPAAVLNECREKAEAAMGQGKPSSKIAAVIIVMIWIVLAILIFVWMGQIWQR